MARKKLQKKVFLQKKQKIQTIYNPIETDYWGQKVQKVNCLLFNKKTQLK